MEIKSEELLLRDLEDSMERVLGIRPRLDTWDDFFSLVFKIQEKMVFVFDEFQNFSRVNSELFSKFQRYWGEGHRDSKHMFLVIGSYVGLMKKLFQERQLLSKLQLTRVLLPTLYPNTFTNSSMNMKIITWEEPGDLLSKERGVNQEAPQLYRGEVHE